MKIEVKGHSGCQIDIVNRNNRLEICKSTSDRKYISRLIMQAEKQAVGGTNMYLSQHIRVPEIYSIEKTENYVAIHMEYVYSKNYISYFEDSGMNDIKNFISAMKSFVDVEISNSPVQTVPTSRIINKLDDVIDKCRSNEKLKGDTAIQDILYKSKMAFQCLSEDIELPIGRCHGDLTFSNILFTGHDYYLIDFLDSFIESPLLDLVKIRQDSKYGWSRLMYSGQTDNVRLSIISNKIDEEINSYYSDYTWYAKYYDLFQLMNFLRILQYAKEEKVIDYLKKVISSML